MNLTQAKEIESKIAELIVVNSRVQNPLDSVEVREGFLYANFYGHGLWIDGTETLNRLNSIDVSKPNQNKFDPTFYHTIKQAFVPGDAPQWAKNQAIAWGTAV